MPHPLTSRSGFARGLIPQSLAPGHPLNDGLVGWWLAVPPSLGGGLWLDALGTNHGTLVSMAAGGSPSGWFGADRPGGIAQLTYDGANGYVTLPPSLVRLDQPFSIAAWVTIADIISNAYVIFAGSTGDTHPYFLFMHRTDRSGLTLQWDDGGGGAFFPVVASRNLIAQVWTHALLTFDPAAKTVRIYQDGVMITNDTAFVTAPFSASGQQYFIGSFNATGTTTRWKGALDDVRLYNRALTPLEALALYAESYDGYPSMHALRQASFGGTQTIAVQPAQSQWQLTTPALNTGQHQSAQPAQARWQADGAQLAQRLIAQPAQARWQAISASLTTTQRTQAQPAQSQWQAVNIRPRRVVSAQPAQAQYQAITPMLMVAGGMKVGGMPAQAIWQADPTRLRRIVPTQPAQAMWQAVAPTITSRLARLMPGSIQAKTGVPAPMLRLQPSSRPDNPALIGARFIAGDWLVQAPRIGLKLSFDFQEADNSWDHRILDIAPIEVSVPPGGGIAAAANVTIKTAEDHTHQSILELWRQYPAINGVPITIDFLLNNVASLPGISNPLRIFTGKIDTITLKNAEATLLCVDDSIQQNLLIPQTLVTSFAFPNAASAAYGQPEPLIYGAGSQIGGAPMLLVDIPTNTYLVAGHPMYLGSGNIAVYDQANQIFLAASGVMTFTNDASALVTFGIFNAGRLSWGSALGVTTGQNAVDGNSQTLALVATDTPDSNLGGYGTLGVFETSPGIPNTNMLQVTFTNHRRSPGSDPTVNGTFYVQTINPSTGTLLRTLYVSPAFRHVTSAQTDIVTLSNVRVAINEQLEVKLIARNDGAPGTVSQTYEVGEVGIAGIVLYSAFSAGLTTMTLPINTQEIRFNSLSYTLGVDPGTTDPFVLMPQNAIDFLSLPPAIILTCNVDSNLDGVGQLTVITSHTPQQLGNNTLSIDFTNHRRSLSSTPTVTGTFFVQTVNPTTTTLLRDNLFVSPPYRQQLNPLSTSFTATAINLGANEQLAVRVLARNEGGPGQYNAAMNVNATTSRTSTTTLTDTVSFLAVFGPITNGVGFGAGPTYIARDSASNLWFTDPNTSQLIKSTSGGNILQHIGSYGLGGGNFVNPVGVTIDAMDQVYVVDTSKANIQVFDATGAFIRQFGGYGSTPGLFFQPWDIAAASDGTLWITDAMANTVQQFTSTGNFLGAFGSAGAANGAFQAAQGIAIDDGGTLWVTDQSPRVQAFTATGTFLRAFGALGTAQGQFNNPAGIAAGISGTLWVTDETNNTVQRFTSAGSFLDTIGHDPGPLNNFNGPIGVVTGTVNQLWVVDSLNDRILRYAVSYLSAVTIITSSTLGFIGTNDAYEIGEIGIKSFYQPAGGNLPTFLYGGSYFGRYDATGTILSYAGQPSGTFFHRPDEVIASILTQEMGRQVTASAFAYAHTFYTTLEFTLDGGIGGGWAVTREQARKVLGDAAQQATAILYPNFDNSFKLVPYPSSAQIIPHLAFSLSNILLEDGADKAPAGPWSDTMQVTLGNLQTVHNAYEVHYAYNAGSRTYGKILTVDKSGSTIPASIPSKAMTEALCVQSFLRHGDLPPLIVDAYWLADEGSANYLLEFLVNYFSHQRTTVEFDTTLFAVSLHLGDFITVSHPLIPAGDDGGIYEVHTIRYLPITGRMHLIASKPSTVSIAIGTVAGQPMRARAQVPTPIVRLTGFVPMVTFSERWEVPDYAASPAFTDFPA